MKTSGGYAKRSADERESDSGERPVKYGKGPLFRLNRAAPRSLWIVLLISLLVGLHTCIRPSTNPLSWDSFGYYLYLPAVFIHHDLGFDDPGAYHQIIEKYKNTTGFYQASPGPLGHWIMKYPMGMAFLFAPFFFIGHLIALMGDYPADGFSAPYVWSINFGSLLFTIAGLFILRKVLLRYFSDAITGLSILVLALGTNYLHIVLFNASMPHNYLFTLYALILWFTVRWHETGQLKFLLLCALICGLNIVSRPSEIICLAIPLLWGVYDRSSFKVRIREWKQKKVPLLLFFLVTGLVILPQLIYWKVYAGQFLYNSYNNPGEGMDLLSPNLWNYLFSFRKGWLIYTPVMVFALIGIVAAIRKRWSNSWSIALFTIGNIYILSSWSNWWYGDSFSQRSIMQSYAVLALPLAFVFQIIRNKKALLQYSAGILVAFCIFLNLFQTWQMDQLIMDSSRMTFDYYKAIFLKTTKAPGIDTLKLVNRDFRDGFKIPEDQGLTPRTLALFDFEDARASEENRPAFQGSNSFRVDSTIEFSPGFSISFDELTKEDYAWIRAEAMVYFEEQLAPGSVLLVVTFEHKGDNYQHAATDVVESCAVPGKWCKVSMDYLTPEVRNKNDCLKVYFWRPGNAVVYIDNLKVEVFE